MHLPFNQELKKGSAELLILSILESRPRHGYEISRQIEERSQGVLKFNVATFYPLLYRMEQRGLVQGRWVEKPNQRRRRYYRLTRAGRAVLKQQRGAWKEFAAAMNQITEPENA
ncbi:MAG: PadR family transcriptional regulator [Acidobacteria bacterium]|nr:PadR family transcriptional regulator [Acidobacteriota bacterium]